MAHGSQTTEERGRAGLVMNFSSLQIKAVTSCSAHKTNKQEIDG